MNSVKWDTPFWPEGVAREISDYNYPLFKLLDDAAKTYPNNTYTIFNGATRTYSQVKNTADKIASFLYKRGIGKGDKVAIFLPNLPHYPEIFFGILKSGAAAVTCNPMYTGPELNHQLKDSGAKVVFCMDHPMFYSNTLDAIKGTNVQIVVACNIKSYLPKLKGFVGGLLKKIPTAGKLSPGHLMFDDIVKSADPKPPSISIDPAEDTALMLYTGGTTGLPKGAELKHSGFTYLTKTIHEWCRFPNKKTARPSKMPLGDYHCFLGALPWYHVFGILTNLLYSCKLGAKVVCIPDPKEGNPPFTGLLKTIQDYRITFMNAVPTLFVAIINHPQIDQFDLSSVEGCFSGGSPLSPEVCRQFEEKTGAVIFEGFGLTETCGAVAVNPTFKDIRKIGSVGFPLPCTDVKVLDIDDPMIEMPRGKEGEIAISGPQIMKGYWNRPDANEESFIDLNGNRYLLTGDIGVIDKNGYISITDRKKDMIIVGGFNVYPRELEDVLYTHPKVELAAVIGIPNDRSGESVKAFIKLKDGETATEDEFNAFCKERLTGYKRPRKIEFKEDIPMSVVGKVLRRVLRDEEQSKETVG